MRLIKQVLAVFDSVNNILAGMSCALAILIMLAVSTEVFIRSSLGISFTGLLETIEFSLLWMTFLGTAWLLRKGGHVNIDLILVRLNSKSRALLNVVTSGIAGVVFGIITWYTVQLTWQDYQSHYILATSMEPLKWPVEAIIPIGCFLLFIQLLRIAYGHVMTYKSLAQDHKNDVIVHRPES